LAGGRTVGGAIVDYAFARQNERDTIREIVEELGLSAGSSAKQLRLWSTRLEPKHAMARRTPP
jgi:hypothetical protein